MSSLSMRRTVMNHRQGWTAAAAARFELPACCPIWKCWHGGDKRRIREYHGTTALLMAAALPAAGRPCIWTSQPSRRLPRLDRTHNFSAGNAATTKDIVCEPASHGSATSMTPAPPRNKKLAAVIREGIACLNQSAAAIQNNAHTAKAIFSAAEDHQAPDARQLSEEHRIFMTAQECLEDLCTRDPSFPLMAADEPILLLGVKVKPSYSHADIYWSLPYRVLSTPELNDREREILNDKMNERLLGAPGRMLIRRVNAVLSSYYPPKLRFKAAPPLLIHQVMYDLEEG